MVYYIKFMEELKNLTMAFLGRSAGARDAISL